MLLAQGINATLLAEPHFRCHDVLTASHLGLAELSLTLVLPEFKPEPFRGRAGWGRLDQGL